MPDINSLSPDFRDALLLRNLVTDSVSNNGLEGLLSTVGQPAGVGTPPESVQASEDIQIDGVYYKDLNTVLNKYQGDDDDYRTANINFLPGNTNSTIAGNPYNHEPYSSDAAELEEFTESNVPATGPFEGGNIREFSTLKNNYVDVDKQTRIDFNTQPVPTYQMGSYLDENGNLNLGGPSTQPLDIVGSLLTGGGVGFDPNGGGAVANFDVRSSLAGRVLTATGAIEDTRLGQLSVGYLAAAIGNNIAFNLQEETIGRVNTNPLSLATGGSLIVPNYNITVAKGGVGVAVDLLERMLGFETPVSLLAEDSSIFSFNTKLQLIEQGNIQRANSMIANSGKGQVLALFGNINANILAGSPTSTSLRQGYAPGFTDPRISKGANTEDAINSNIYAFDDGNGNVKDVLNGINSPVSQATVDKDDKRWTDGVGSGFENDYFGTVTFGEDGSINKNGFIWGDDKWNKASKEAFDSEDYQDFYFGYGDNLNEKKSILYKTKELFKSNNMRTLVSGRGIKGSRSQIQSGIRDGGSGAGFMSKGSGVLSSKAFQITDPEELTNTNPADIFCRTWSPLKKYDQVEDLIRHGGSESGLEHKAPNRNKWGDVRSSVLEDTGFVRIGPYASDVTEDGKKVDTKRYMFSIENLAWADENSKLLPSELGPGDELSGLKGRIMWFPPYDISFNESSSINWEKSNFIGRGEPIYTYNNTERTGTLSWKIIIDHPNYMNYFPAEWDDDQIASWFAGCLEMEEVLCAVTTPEERDNIEVSQNKKPKTTVDEQKPAPVTFEIFFENDSSIVPIGDYEDGLDENGEPVTNPNSGGVGVTEGQGDVGGAVYNYPDNTDFGLNAIPFTIGTTTIQEGWNRGEWVDTLGEYFENECKHCKIKIEGFSSPQGNQAASSATNTDNNNKLSKKRADSVKKYLEDALVFGGYQAAVADKFSSAKVTGGGVSTEPCPGQDGQDRIGCKKGRKVTITIDYDANQAKKDKPSVPAPDPVEPPPPTTAIPKCRFFTEANYFEKLRETDKFAYSSLKEKIKFFHPSFHSITPEGFNSRLNFLLQCTRQGPTLNEDGNPGNLAFGRAPVCILRIGDFYYTKIIIDSMNIDYEPLVWDLNPEGVGVQPMIANISINFSFIGGSSLNGPINKLQNAISFNFFANAEVYDPRADRVVKSDNPKPNSKATAEIQPGKFPDDRLPVEDSDKKEGLSNNTNEPTESQEDVAATENSTEEAVQEPEMSEDAKILNNIRLNAYTNNDDNHHVVIISDELELLGEGWSYNVGTFTNGQFIKLDTQPINVDEDLSGNNLNRLDIDSTLSRGDGIRIAWDYDTQESLAYAAQRYNTTEVANCYSAKTDTNMTIPAISFGVEFWKEGEETIRWSTTAFLLECDDEFEGEIDNPRYSIADNLYTATSNKGGCLIC